MVSKKYKDETVLYLLPGGALFHISMVALLKKD